MQNPSPRLRDQSAGGGGLVLPGRRQDTDGLVVAGQTVDTRLDQNKAELGVLVLAVALEVLADEHGLEREGWSVVMVRVGAPKGTAKSAGEGEARSLPS